MPSGELLLGILLGPAGTAGLGAVSLALLALTIVYRGRWRTCAREAVTSAAQAEAAAVTLAAAPIGCLAFSRRDASIQASPYLMQALGLGDEATVALSRVLGAFEPAASGRLSSAVERLRNEGAGFDLTLRAGRGVRTFQVTGERALGPDGQPAADLVWFRDITALNAELDQARAETQAMAAILDSFPLPIWRRDPDLRLTYCNEAYARAVAEPREEVMRAAIELLGKAKTESAHALAKRALDTDLPARESHHIVIDGARRLLELDERRLGDGTLIGHAVDRTDEEDLSTELKRHVEAHADVLENLGSAIAIFGKDLHLRFFNSAYARLWHLDESFLNTEPDLGDILEVLREGRRLPEHPNFPQYKQECIRDLQTMIDTTEELLHLPDGSTLRSVASPHPFGGVLLTYEDVTDRLTLERSYNTLIEVQRETLNNLYEGVAVFGADGRLKLYNPAYARIWNLPEDLLAGQPHVRELIARGRPFFDLSQEDWDAFVESRTARATEAESRGGRRSRADGTEINWAQVPLPDGASLFTFLDVTDTTRVERALRDRNDALETADRLKSEFVANISYELRTPLNAIVGFAEILENQFFGPLNERQLEYSRGIVEASQRLIALINDILDLATIEAGYMELDLAPVDIGEMLESIQTLGHERARSQNITLRVECDENIGTLTADSRRLRQALFNLLSNAFKFTPEGGTVTVTASRTDTEMLLVVSDSGVGIREEDLGRVFGKFERGSGQAGQTGAGLGLSLVKSLIELHGGRVELRSAPQQGTQVTCRIPLNAARQPAPSDQQSLSA